MKTIHRKITQISFFLVTLTLFSTAHAACQKPSSKEIQTFFSGNKKWTEVVSQNDNRIAARNPVEMNLNFTKPEASVAKAGGKSLSANGVLFCKGSNKNEIVIQKALGKITLTRRGNNLITSYDIINKTLYYRPANNVEYNTSELIDNDEDLMEQTAVI